jgi:hypothetical protein
MIALLILFLMPSLEMLQSNQGKNGFRTIKEATIESGMVMLNS